MKQNLWPFLFIGCVICGALSIITFGAIKLEGPGEASYTVYTPQIKNTYHPVYISSSTIAEIDKTMEKLKELNRLGAEEERKIQIAEAPLKAEQERQIAAQNALNIQKVQENRTRIVFIENRLKEIDVLIIQKTEGKKDEEEIIKKLDVEIAKKLSQGKPTGYNATDSMIYGQMRDRVGTANAQISNLKDEKDELNKELGKLK